MTIISLGLHLNFWIFLDEIYLISSNQTFPRELKAEKSGIYQWTPLSYAMTFFNSSSRILYSNLATLLLASNLVIVKLPINSINVLETTKMQSHLRGIRKRATMIQILTTEASFLQIRKRLLLHYFPTCVNQWAYSDNP